MMAFLKIVAVAFFLVWYAGLVAAAVMTIGDSKWKFSLRALLIATTLLALMFGVLTSIRS